MKKFGTTIMTYQSEFGPIVYKNGNVEENIKECLALGYNCVDLFVPKSTKEQLSQMKDLFLTHGVEITTYLPLFLGKMTISLSDILLENRLEAIEIFKQEMQNSKILGARSISLGLFRGNIASGDTKADCIARLAKSVKIIDEYAGEIGVRVNIEPINRYEISTLNSAKESIAFIKDNGYKNIGLLLDIFHMNIEDGDMVAAIKEAGTLIGNMHMADSNRRACGMGHTDYKAILKALKAIDYQGPLTMEAFPEPTPKSCSEQSINLLKNILAEVR